MNHAATKQSWLIPNLAKSSIHISVLAIGLGFSPLALLPLLSLAGMAAVYYPTKQNQQGWSLLLWPLAFAALSILSVATGVEPERGVLFLQSYIPCGLILLVIIRLFDLRDLMRLFASLTLLGGFISAKLGLLWFLMEDVSPSQLVEQAAIPVIGVPNDLTLLALIAPFTLVLFLQGAGWHWSRLWRALLLMAVVLSTAIIVFYQSRSALLGLITGLIMLAICLIRGMREWLILLTVILAAVLLGLLLDAFAGFGMLAKFSDPVRWTRLRLWLTAWQMFIDAPWLGQGVGGFSVLYEEYATALSLPEWLDWDQRHMPWAHNLYLELFAERGLLGALCFGGWIISLVVALARIMRLEEAMRAPAAALFAAPWVILTAGLFDLSLLRLWVMLMLTFVTAMTVILVSDV